MDSTFAQAFEVTWPAAEYADAGGFRVGRGLGGGGRVSSARVTGVWTEDDIDAAVAIHKAWDQRPLFRVGDNDQHLISALNSKGFVLENPTAIMEIESAALTSRDLPPVTAFEIWPPLAIQRDIWNSGNIGPGRQSVMGRVTTPAASVLGRVDDRAAGALFVALYQGVAMVHCVVVLPPWRRKGLAVWMMQRAGIWASENGAARVGLAVSRSNLPALALYRHLGFREIAGYGYYSATA